MSFPVTDIVMLSVLAVSIFAGLVTWWWLSQRVRSLEFELQPMVLLTRYAPKPANEVIEDEAAPDSSVRIRVGARLRAVDSH